MHITNTPIPEGIRDRDAFVLTLMQALHLFGTPSHRLEQAMNAIANDLDMKLQCLATPTSVTAAIGPLENQRTFLLRVEPSEANLEKLAELQAVMQKVSRKELKNREAKEMVDEIVARPSRFGAIPVVLAFMLVAACVSILFGGSPFDALIAGLIGLPIGALVVFSGSRPRVSMLLPALTAFVAAVFARVFAHWIPVLHPILITVASLIVLVPGLSLTSGINELAHRHLVSGTSRMMGALVVLLQLALGAAAGWGLVDANLGAFVSTPTEAAHPLLIAVIILFTAVGFIVLFQARWSDYWAVLLGAAAAYTSTALGAFMFSPEFGAALGAWSVGCLANIIGRLRDKPAMTTILPGILLLVPGALGFRSLQAVISDDVLTGVEGAMTTLMVSIALVIGLFLSNLTIAPRKIF